MSARQELQRKKCRRRNGAIRPEHERGQCVDTARGEALGIELSLAAGRGVAAFRKGQERLAFRFGGELQPNAAFASQSLERYTAEPDRLLLVLRTQALSNQVIHIVAKAGVVEAQALRQLREEPDVGACLAQRLYGLLGKLDVVVAVAPCTLLCSRKVVAGSRMSA